MRTAWLAGLVVGAASGALSLLLPVFGWAFGFAFFAGALVRHLLLPSVGGFFLGGGTVWLALLLQADRRCDAFNGPAQSCVSPDLLPWLVAGLLMLLVGAAATIVAARR
jgi:hypothetical protein